MLNIDFLKNNCIKDPWQHGLGFIALYMKDRSIINFHSDLSNHDSKSPHSHAGNFESTCLFGKLKNIIYDYEEVSKSDWYLMSVTCKEGEKPEVINENIKPIIISEEIQNEGDVINHFYKNIHDFEILSKYACTKVIRTTPKMNDPVVIQSKNVKHVCAYAGKGTAKENWEIIDEILNEQKNVLL